MKYYEDPERERVLLQALSARTLEELRIATEELDVWVAAHPEDVGIIDAYEQMALMELAVKEIAAQKEQRVTAPAAGK
jgi:hypothetical protein